MAHRARRPVMLALLVTLSTGCLPVPAFETAYVPAFPIAVPAGSYAGVAWGAGNWLVAAMASPADGPDVLWRFHRDGTGLQALNLQDDLSCRRRTYYYPASLSDGRIGYVIECDPVDTTQGPDSSFWAYDPLSGATQRLVQGSFKVGTGQFTWNPAAGRGIWSATGGWCQISWLTQAGMSPFDVTIGDGQHPWRLAQNGGDVADCAGHGLTDAVDWSHDGTSIALFAGCGPAPPGRLPRFSAPMDLYLMSPANLKPRRVLSGIGDPLGLRWSPDGRWLAFAADRVGDAWGVWLFRPADQRLVRVSAQEDGGIAWSPDGSKLVVGRSLGFDKPYQLMLLDVGVVTAP